MEKGLLEKKVAELETDLKELKTNFNTLTNQVVRLLKAFGVYMESKEIKEVSLQDIMITQGEQEG